MWQNTRFFTPSFAIFVCLFALCVCVCLPVCLAAAGFSDDVTASCDCNTNLNLWKFRTFNFSCSLSQSLRVLSSVGKRKTKLQLILIWHLPTYVMGFRPGQWCNWCSCTKKVKIRLPWRGSVNFFWESSCFWQTGGRGGCRQAICFIKCSQGLTLLCHIRKIVMKFPFFRKEGRWTAENTKESSRFSKRLCEIEIGEGVTNMRDTGGWRCRRCRRPWYGAVPELT